jgi:hypothetical protein
VLRVAGGVGAAGCPIVVGAAELGAVWECAVLRTVLCGFWYCCGGGAQEAALAAVGNDA